MKAKNIKHRSFTQCCVGISKPNMHLKFTIAFVLAIFNITAFAINYARMGDSLQLHSLVQGMVVDRRISMNLHTENSHSFDKVGQRTSYIHTII